MSTAEQLYDAILDGDCARIDALVNNRMVNAELGEDNLLRAALIGITEAPNPKSVKHLIDLGVQVNSKDRCGWTPLHFAARKKSQNADPALSTACVKLLIDAGADVNAKDNDGITPIHRSVAESPWNLEMIELLLDSGAIPTDSFFRYLNAIADDPEKDAVLSMLAKFR